MRLIFVSMIGETNYLLVYGTLLRKDNANARLLNANAVFLAKAKFKGLLYDMGDYPGAICSPGGDNYVYGSIFCLSDKEQVLKTLDDYEGFGQEQAQPNLFIRQLIHAETEGRTLACWVYTYNLPTDGYKLIVSGNYLAYKNLFPNS